MRHSSSRQPGRNLPLRLPSLPRAHNSPPNRPCCPLVAVGEACSVNSLSPRASVCPVFSGLARAVCRPKHPKFRASPASSDGPPSHSVWPALLSSAIASLLSLHSYQIATTHSAQRVQSILTRRRRSPRGPAPAMSPSYSFPADKLLALKDDSRTPLVLVSCGSFSPITYLHLRMFEMCKDWAKENTHFEVVAGYLSPVADAYKKQGLAFAEHRIEMCRLATEASPWIMVDDWEASKAEYTRTALVLDHFEHEINEVLGGVADSTGKRRRAKIALMSGADLIETMSVPHVWAREDLDHILGRYGAFIIERNGTDLNKALEALEPWRSNIYAIPQLIQNDISSTKVRQFLRKDMSIRYFWTALSGHSNAIQALTHADI